jgi:transcriptional regulator with XRE-family HTH domain
MSSKKLKIIHYSELFFREFNMDMNSFSIWERLRDLAKKRKKSLKNASKETGVSEGAISGWKKSYPTVDNLALLANFYGVSLDYLVFGKSPVPGLSPEALEIAKAAEKLNPEGKRAALGMVEGLQKVYPCEISKSTGMAS